MENVKTKGEGEGAYRLSLGSQSVLAVRQPDKYFEIDLGGTKHKGYLKDLKAKFAAYVASGGEAQEQAAPAKAGRPARTPAAPPAAPEEPSEEPTPEPEQETPPPPEPDPLEGLDHHQRTQRKIDRLVGYQTLQCTEFCKAYNEETARVKKEGGQRFYYRIGKRTREFVTPPMDSRYDEKTDTYDWAPGKGM